MEKVIVIVGPTAVGKTELSVELAHQFSGEIISGDSMQIYKEMTIGTAKATTSEQDGIPHYLIDELSYREEYNVKEFQKRARAYIHDIHQRGKMPIICGGTGLYIKACLYDYEFPNQEIDMEFRTFLTSCSSMQLYEMLKIIDPAACDTIHQHNRQRMIRALEIAHQGKKKSEIVAQQEHQPMYDIHIIGLTIDREKLYERINMRVDKMMKKGLLDEVQGIITKDDDWNLQSLQGIGYKEWKEYFHREISLEETIEKIKKNSRNFAKRRYTWFHNQLPVHWYDIQTDHWKSDVKKDAEVFLNKK